MSQENDTKKIWIPQREAARIFDVKQPSISKAVKRGNLQKNSKGQVEQGQVGKWVKANRKEPAEAQDGGLDLFSEEARLKHFSANLKELDFKVRSGELIEVPLVIDEFSKMIAVTQQKLRNIPSKLAPRIGRDVTKLIKEEIDKALYELSEYNPVTGKPGTAPAKSGDTKRGARVPSAPRSNRKPVGKPRKKAVKRGKR